MNKLEEKISLEINRRTAILLRDTIYALGEHQAAGGRIPYFNTEDSESLGAILKDLEYLLGRTKNKS